MATETAIKGDYESSTCDITSPNDLSDTSSDELTNPKPRYRKWALLDKSRRLKASARERKRRHVLNSALERLRKKVPCLDQNPQKLSKIEVLRQAIGYISDLSHCLQSANSPLTALTNPVFLEQNYGTQQATSFHNIGSMLYRKAMLLDNNDHDCLDQNMTYEECFSPETPTTQYYEQTSSEDFDYGINDAELDIYLRGFAQ